MKMETMFKAHDIRCKREMLDGHTSHLLVGSIAQYFQKDLGLDSVVLARDARLGGEALMQIALQVLEAVGMTVFVESDPIGTCQFYYACMTHPDSAGIMITASHNPASYIGMKLVGKDLLSIAANTGIAKIRDYFEQESAPPPKRGGCVVPMDTLQDFIDYSVTLSHLKYQELSGLAVVCEFLHGSYALAISRTLAMLGVQAHLLHPAPDGNFPAGDPNPGIEKSMHQAHAYLCEHPHDLLFAYDGDGDRMDVIYKGRQLSPALVMSIIADECLCLAGEGVDPTFLFDSKAAPPVLCEMARRGKSIKLVKNGHSAIKEMMRTHADVPYLAAVEESAHYYLMMKGNLQTNGQKRYATENTLFFTLVVLKAYHRHPQAFEEARRLQDSFYRRREWSLLIKDEQKRSELVTEIAEKLTQRGAIVVDRNSEGESLGAKLLRFNLPQAYDTGTVLPSSWFQVFQRISQSEDNLLRWEVVASEKSLADEVCLILEAIQDKYKD